MNKAKQTLANALDFGCICEGLFSVIQVTEIFNHKRHKMENLSRKKITEILNYINSDEIDKALFEIFEKHQIEEIDKILGKNKFIYFNRPNHANICLVYRRKNSYLIRMYWINEFLKN